MKKFLLNVLVVFHISFAMKEPMMAQTDTSSDISWTKMKLKKMDNTKLIGYLYQLNDDSIMVLTEKINGARTVSLLRKSNPAATTVPVNSIDHIMIQKGAKAIWLGSGIGLASGVAIGFASGSDPEENFIRFTAADKAFILGTTGLVTGALVGAIIYYASRKIFRIKGRAYQYRISRETMSGYTLLH